MLAEYTFKGRPLNEKESKNLILLFNLPDVPLEEAHDDLTNSFLCQILLKRIAVWKLPFRMSDKFLLMSLVTFAKNPGKIIMLLRLCWQHWKKTGCTFFTLDTWAQDIFPFGVPTEEELQGMWESQKSSSAPFDNLLDDVHEWQ